LEDEEYFKSDVHRILFLLLEVDGRRRNAMLGIRRIHYCSKRKAKKWFLRLALKIHPDRCDHPKAAEGFRELNELYEILTMHFD
jgi:DnaJ-class molecular chaperone